jgi:hypothetical protein
VAPTPVAPTPVAPTPVAPTPVAPTPPDTCGIGCAGEVDGNPCSGYCAI